MNVIGHNYELSVLVDENDYQTFNLSSYKWRRIIGRTTTYVARLSPIIRPLSNTSGNTHT